MCSFCLILVSTIFNLPNYLQTNSKKYWDCSTCSITNFLMFHTFTPLTTTTGLEWSITWVAGVIIPYNRSGTSLQRFSGRFPRGFGTPKSFLKASRRPFPRGRSSCGCSWATTRLGALGHGPWGKRTVARPLWSWWEDSRHGQVGSQEISPRDCWGSSATMPAVASQRSFPFNRFSHYCSALMTREVSGGKWQEKPSLGRISNHEFGTIYGFEDFFSFFCWAAENQSFIDEFPSYIPPFI